METDLAAVVAPVARIWVAVVALAVSDANGRRGTGDEARRWLRSEGAGLLAFLGRRDLAELARHGGGAGFEAAQARRELAVALRPSWEPGAVPGGNTDDADVDAHDDDQVVDQVPPAAVTKDYLAALVAEAVRRGIELPASVRSLTR